jgi:PmbA protein
MQRLQLLTAAEASRISNLVEVTGREAAARTIRRLNACKLKTGKMPVLFSPEVAGGSSATLQALFRTTLYRNASFLGDAGAAGFPGWLQIIERPHLLRGAGSASFDGEGVATRERAIVENGYLKSYLLSSYSARRLGMQTTGNAGGARNVLLQPGKSSSAELMREMGKGFYVTEVMGQGVNS